MKKYISISPLLYCLIFLLLSSNNSALGQTPEAVKIAFQKKYPNENDPDWKIDKNKNFESSFKKHGKHYRADFSPQGYWIETERNIKKKDLPEAVRDKIKRDYDDYKIYEIEEVQHYQKGIFYDVEFKIDGKKKDIEFNAVGIILNN
jgi:uncharacterized protein YxeA